MIQLNFPLQAHNNKQWLVLYNYFGFVLPENIGGKIANYNIFTASFNIPKYS